MRERGAVILLLMTVFLAAGTYLFVSSADIPKRRIERDKITERALAQAKDALMGYAITYGDMHPNEVNGYLPLPDIGTSRSTLPNASEGSAAGNFAGNSLNLSVVGRLPWRTLGLAPLRDGSGECLWYAVSGSYQNVLKSDFMNWDTLGQFDTFASDGTPGGTISAVGANYHGRPAGIIFAAGSLLPGQNRTASTTDAVTICGGNYDARNYLDTFNPDAQINNIVNYFSGSINNATGIFGFSNPKRLAMGPIPDIRVDIPANNLLVNDRMIAMTPDDLFGRIKNRHHFDEVINQMLADGVANLNTLPSPATMDFSTIPVTETAGGGMVGILEIGRMPKAAVVGNKYLENWQDNLLYAICASGTACLKVNGSACRGILIFAGERTALQSRATNAQKNDWGNYLEGDVYTAFSTGSDTFNGASVYSKDSPSTDILGCIS